MAHWWVTDWINGFGVVFFGSWVFWMITSIVLHELSHGWAALWCGDDTPRALGHMTLNPLVHMGQVSLIMFAITGMTWGLMPVNPYNFRRRHDDALVALAGPGMNLLIVGVCLGAAAAWVAWTRGSTTIEPHVVKNVSVFLFAGLLLNVSLFLFNLIPVPPLDGSAVMASFVPRYERYIRSEQGQIAGLIAFALLFYVGGRYVWNYTFAIAFFVLTRTTGTSELQWMPTP